MKMVDYRAHLQAQGIPDAAAAEHMAVIDEFVRYLAVVDWDAPGTTAKAVVESFAHRLIAAKRNTLENFAALRDYAGWLGARPLYVAFIEVMDCHNALAVLADALAQQHRQAVRDRVFIEEWPPLGADEPERCAYTRTLTEQMARELTPAAMSAAWFQVQHGIPAHVWQRSDEADKELYRQCEDIDEFLARKRSERDSLLTRLHDENRLWYTVAITDEVLDYVKRDPAMEVGQREGNKVYITKIPYNAERYLHETDPKLKRYYACHCPLARQAILDERPLSPQICDCSMGHASHYLAGLGQELHGEVLESVLKGDSRCRFVFYLPADMA